MSLKWSVQPRVAVFSIRLVCLSVGLLKTLWMIFRAIFRRNGHWIRNDLNPHSRP